MSERILHLTLRADWESAQREGEYRCASLAEQGFIHCSTPEQIVRVADSFYAGQHGLVLLSIDPGRLTDELKWEPPDEPHPDSAVSDERFPHLYGPLNLEAVVEVLPFEPGDDGTFTLPSTLGR